MKLLLRVMEGENTLVEKAVGIGVFRIGRSEFSDLVLDGKEVSRSHVEIRVTENAIYVTNMSGSGRLKVNRERVETAEIKNGDFIEIASYKIIFQIDASSEVAIGTTQENMGMGLDSQQPAQGEVAEENQKDNDFDLFKAEVSSDPPENEEDASPKEEKMADPPQVEAAAMGELREFPIQERASLSPSYEGALALKSEDTQLESKPIFAKLVIVEGPDLGKEIPLDGYEVTLGRSRKADVFINDDKLSRKHAKIVRFGMGYRLIDLESRNGTHVNGLRVLEHPLSSFDVIEIGRTKIKFLIFDFALGAVEKGGALQPVATMADTKSVQIMPDDSVVLAPFEKPSSQSSQSTNFETPSPGPKKSKRNIILAGVVVFLVTLYTFVPDSPETSGEPEKTKSVSEEVKKPGVEPILLPQYPKEFTELSSQNQRSVEGHYNNALRFQEREDYDQAYVEMKELHKIIPFYKESKKLEALYLKKMSEKHKTEAAERAARDRHAELQINIEDGLEYLKQGDFDRAAEAFNSALILDPQNATATKGLKAAQLRIRDIEQLPPEVNPEVEKRKLVAQLMEEALKRFEEKSYQETINLAEKIRAIEIKGETEYLNQAKQLIDRARLQQKEEFEPFLIQAKEKFAEGDYNLSRDLCDEMLKRDKDYEAAQECSLRAKKQLNRLAKEAYTHGYILESMNRIEEAKQYWTRAKNYVRPGDPYYEKILKKLDNYQ
ncbi:MAG: FHA domain-containing protein [Proteobacteria bacterium]|nr:FHA domain-containing protein [Pseudomonadota bacterium]NDD03825.1 FHA domain-containing protein [Pseudomonadota bacterium]NDG26323.1 FHA domain-containing protein [Pseudomonadota bacterium]